MLDLERPNSLYAFYRADWPPGRAASWLIERFKLELPTVGAPLPDALRRGASLA